MIKITVLLSLSGPYIHSHASLSGTSCQSYFRQQELHFNQYGSIWTTCAELITTPGLEPLFDFGYGQDVGADLSGDRGEVRVLLLQLHQIMELSWNPESEKMRPE